jgi:hypothetical protein
MMPELMSKKAKAVRGGRKGGRKKTIRGRR